MNGVSFSVGARDETGYIPVYDSAGWARGFARSEAGANEIRRELEAGALCSPILDPVVRES